MKLTLNSLSKVKTGFSCNKPLRSLLENKSLCKFLSLKEDVGNFICAMVQLNMDKHEGNYISKMKSIISCLLVWHNKSNR